MSTTDLKARLREIPGIEQLTVQLLRGRQVYSFGGHVVELDASASDAEVQTAIRAAVSSPVDAQIPAGEPVAAGGVIPPATPAASPSASLIPLVHALNAADPQPSQPKATAMSVTGAGAAGLSLKALIEKQKAKISADLETNMAKIQEGFDKQNAAVAAVGTLGDKVHAEADDLMASVGQFSNMLGE